MFSLTATHLRFVCEALTPIRLAGYRAGPRLRAVILPGGEFCPVRCNQR